jgi:hypothetical protein
VQPPSGLFQHSRPALWRSETSQRETRSVMQSGTRGVPHSHTTAIVGA